MTIAQVASQAGGTTADNSSTVARAYGSNVTAGNLVYAVVHKYDAGSAPFNSTDLAKSAGTATIGAFTLHASDQNGSDTPHNIGVFSAIVSGTGSLTLTCTGSSGSYWHMSTDELSATNGWDSSRQEATANTNPTGGSTDTTQISDDMTSAGAAVFIGGCELSTGNNVTTLTKEAAFTEVSAERDGTQHVVGISMLRVVTSGTTDRIESTSSSSELFIAAGVVLKEVAAGGTVNAKSIADALTISETARPYQYHNRLNADAVTVIEEALYREWVLQLNDGATVVDGKDGYPVRGRRVNEALTLSETVNRFFYANKLAADAITILDSIAKACLFYRRVDDALTISEVVTGLFINSGGTTYNKTISDAITLVETIGKRAYFTRPTSDSLQIIEVMISGAFRNALIANSVTTSDSLGKSIERNRTASDIVSLFESVSRNMVRGAVAQDMLTITDGTVRRYWFTRLLQDAATIIEQIVATYQPDGSTLYDVRARVGFDKSSDPVIGENSLQIPVIGGYQ